MKKFYAGVCICLALMGSIILPIHFELVSDRDRDASESAKHLPSAIPAITNIEAQAEVGVDPGVQTATTVRSADSSPDIPVLMYHILLDGRNDLISVDPVRFKEQMSAIKAAGFTTITDHELADHLEKNTELPEKPILITFDDGYKSTYTEAFPVLEELDMKATINVIASRIFEMSSTLHPDEYEKITWQDARSMQGTILIQAHTWDSHHKKTNGSDELRGVISGRMANGSGLETQVEFEKRVLEDLRLSKTTIEEKLGYEVVSLAYPYGEYSADTIRLAQDVGFKLAFTVKPGMVNSATDAHFELDRITADGAYTGEQLLAKIEASE